MKYEENIPKEGFLLAGREFSSPSRREICLLLFGKTCLVKLTTLGVGCLRYGPTVTYTVQSISSLYFLTLSFSPVFQREEALGIPMLNGLLSKM